MTTNEISFEDFVAKAKAAGMLNSFSAADLSLAQKDPAAGLSILSFKQDYAAAATDEARALANAGAEQIRRSRGGYSGGSDGAGYFSEDSNYVNQLSEPAHEADSEAKSSSAQDAYRADAARLWDSYKKQYLREGELAYRNSLGQSAANTGGIASTAAVTAAQQAQNYYAAQASDKKAALYQQAFENWLAERELQNDTAATEATIAAKQAQTESDAANSEAAAAQQIFDNAMAKWKAYGYVTEDVAQTLALPVGTAYTDQAYNEWKQAYEEAKSGIKTGKTQYDTVNLGERVVTDSAADHSTLRYGANNLDVQAMQRYLIALGYSCGADGADGKFGTATHRALINFQKAVGVYADGVCGPVTWTALIEAAGA